MTEAGGRVSKMSNAAFEVEQPDLLATNGRAIHDGLSAVLSEVC